MSSILYNTCVVFDQHGASPRGLVKKDGVNVEIDELPDVPGLPQRVASLYYAPEVRVFEIRELAGGNREMQAPEIQALAGWLDRVVNTVRTLAPRLRKEAKT